ncbi:guanine deaminase [Thiomonas sp. FB-6]|uniref:guanine deaminase n=1 Tax=Thiomonas sp. FB-6 TaxID=1158291 RepID=UPI001E4006A1|nr:guanine deaminase [Thiomonas sp. FB-6]
MSPREASAPAIAPAAAPGRERVALRGDVLHLRADPGAAAEAPPCVHFEPDGWLLAEGGRVVELRAADAPPDPSWPREDWRGHLLLPGFIDLHVHAPQLDVIGAWGDGLLRWLDDFTYPAEARWADAEHARRGAGRFVRQLLAHGTTSAMVFPTVHRHGVDALFEAAREQGMCLVSGKVLMDRNVPEALRDEVTQAERDCVALIESWHGRERLRYALTPRFAPACSDEQLRMCARLLRIEHPRAGAPYLQTHVAENRDELRWVRELYPASRSYLDVYAGFGLLGRRSVLAHGIWLDDADRALLAERGSTLAFSPSSNLFLGSGLFDWARADAAGVRVAVASDVGAGTSLCQLRSAAEACKVLALQGTRLSAWRALYALTRGAAAALELEPELGHFEPGAWADVVAWRWAAGELQEHRLGLARSLHERLYAWLHMADERNVAAVYVAGRRVQHRPS